MFHLGKCENHGCEEDAVGCTDDGDYLCTDCLFDWSMEMNDDIDMEWDDEDEEDTGFPDSEVELLDTSLFDGEQDG